MYDDAMLAFCRARVPYGHDLLTVVQDTLVLEAWSYCYFSQADAARLLGIHKRVLNYRLGELKLRPTDLEGRER